MKGVSHHGDLTSNRPKVRRKEGRRKESEELIANGSSPSERF